MIESLSKRTHRVHSTLERANLGHEGRRGVAQKLCARRVRIQQQNILKKQLTGFLTPQKASRSTFSDFSF
jgi:hypothetical protein